MVINHLLPGMILQVYPLLDRICLNPLTIRAGYFLGGNVALGGLGPLDCHDMDSTNDLTTRQTKL